MKNEIRLGMLALAMVGLTACESEIDRAKRRLQMVEHGGSKEAKCRAHREIEEVYLEAGDTENYENTRSVAYVECNSPDIY